MHGYNAIERYFTGLNLMPFDKSSRPSRSYLKHAPLVLAASALVLVQASHAEAPSAGAALKPAAQIVLRTDEAAAGAKPANRGARFWT